MGFVARNKCSLAAASGVEAERWRTSRLEQRRREQRVERKKEDRSCRYAIDKSENSYAINRPRAADCTGFLYLWPLKMQRAGGLAKQRKMGGGLAQGGKKVANFSYASI